MHTAEKIYETIKIEEQRNVLTLRIFRPEANNSINTTLVKELMAILNHYETIPGIKVIVLEGMPDNFCTGMDFKAINAGDPDTLADTDPNGYYEILKHFSMCSKVIISKVEGKVNAGGIGFVAASDIVIADEKATFGLSEALFGLLPACVMPFLIRRIGYQKALWMTITTQAISSQRAHQIGLVDELSSNANDTLRKSLLRLTKLDVDTIKDLKDYMSKLWIINDQTQLIAVNKIASLLNSEKVQSNIINFIQNGKFPWDK